MSSSGSVSESGSVSLGARAGYLTGSRASSSCEERMRAALRRPARRCALRSARAAFCFAVRWSWSTRALVRAMGGVRFSARSSVTRPKTRPKQGTVIRDSHDIIKIIVRNREIMRRDIRVERGNHSFYDITMISMISCPPPI